MSLINDALKRAKAAQDQAPPVAVPELRFRQPTPQPPAKQSSPWLLILLACGMLAFAAIAFFALRKSDAPLVVNATSSRKVEAKASEPAQQPSSAQEPGASWDASSENASTVRTEQATEPQNVNTVVAETQRAQQATTIEPVESAQVQSGEPAAAISAPPVIPKAPELKLQGIFYNPARPSAMINGRTLFVGDKLGELRVIAIGQTSTTLAGAGHTNILALSE